MYHKRCIQASMMVHTPLSIPVYIFRHKIPKRCYTFSFTSPMMSSSSFLLPLQGPSLQTFSSVQSTQMSALQQLIGCWRHRNVQQQYDKKITPARQKLDDRVVKEEKRNGDFDHYFGYIRSLLCIQPGFWYISPPDASRKPPSQLDAVHFVNSPLTMVGSPVGVKNKLNDVTDFNALLLSKEPMLASKEAAALAQFNELTYADATASHLPSLDEPASIEKATVRSGLFLERRSRKRKMLKQNTASCIYRTLKTAGTNETVAKAVNSNDSVAFFLRVPKTKRLLTIKEERDLFSQIKVLVKVEKVKQKLNLQFGREPTPIEWAKAVGMSYHELQSCLVSGKCSWDKMIYANLRLVAHIAKYYQGQGLSLQDLLQAGSMGLMRSMKTYNPEHGNKFVTYAYLFIKHSIEKEIIKNFRLVRIPSHVFILLKKIKRARMSFIQQQHYPSKSDLAKLIGISVEKLEWLLLISRNPVSMERLVWKDQDGILQEITAEPYLETSVVKQFMRQEVINLLEVLPPRERQIIHLRYGLHDGEPKSLQDIGDLYGLSRERIRQLEVRAMDKLKCCLTEQGLKAYVCLLSGLRSPSLAKISYSMDTHVSYGHSSVTNNISFPIIDLWLTGYLRDLALDNLQHTYFLLTPKC